MKTVFFVRHAKSSWNDSSLADINRPLNDRGERDAPFMAKMLKNRDIEPDRILSSPARRALDTARYFADAFGIPPKEIEVRPEIYEALPDDLEELVRGLPDEWSTVLIFGHNPTLTSLVNHFTDEFIDNIPTCGIVQVNAKIKSWKKFEEESARVSAFYYPKQFLV